MHDFTETFASIVSQNPGPSLEQNEHLLLNIFITITPLALFLLVGAILVFVQKPAHRSTSRARVEGVSVLNCV